MNALTRTLSLGTLAALLAAHLPGCASSNPDARNRPAAFQADSPPDDFSLAVTVFARPGATRRATYTPERTPARYILEPGGVLHAGVGPANDDVYPGQVRILSKDEILSLWRDLQATGLLRLDHPALVGRVGPFTDPSLADPDAIITMPPTYSLFYTIDGVQRTLSLDSADADAAKPLLTRLAALAWVGPR